MFQEKTRRFGESGWVIKRSVWTIPRLKKTWRVFVEKKLSDSTTKLENQLPLIDVRPIALVWPWTLNYELDHQSPVSYGHDLLDAKVEGQLSVSAKDRGEMDGASYITLLANVVVNSMDAMEHRKWRK